MENWDEAQLVEEGVRPSMALQQGASLLELRATYARPLYVFRRDQVGTLVQTLQGYMEPEEIEAERAEKERKKRRKPDPEQGEADTTRDAPAKKPRTQNALDTWIFSLLFSIEGGEQGVRDLMALRRSKTTSGKLMAAMSINFKSTTTLEADTGNPALVAVLLDRVEFGHLDLAIQRAVTGGARSEPLSEDEEVAAVMRCPYVLVNWIVSFGTHTPDDYVKLCARKYEPNWMHGLLADIGRDFPGFNQYPKQCPLALNTEDVLERRGGASRSISLASVRETPRCLYVTSYVTAAYTNNLTPAAIMANFQSKRNAQGLHVALMPHRAVVLVDVFLRPFRRAFLSKYAPGMGNFDKRLDFSVPLNLTTYYDVLCHFYRNVLHRQDRKMDEVKLAEPIQIEGIICDMVLSMPMLNVDSSADLARTEQQSIRTVPLVNTTITLDANGQPEENALLHQSTLSELVKSHYYGNGRRGPLRL